MSKLAEALKKAIEAHPVTLGIPEGKNIGEMLEKEFWKAGYMLQLQQHGMEGTAIVAVKIEDINTNIPIV